MGSRELKVLYKETRLNLEPSMPSSVVPVKIQSPGAFKRLTSRTNGSPSRFVAEDEKAYRAKNLATASSIYRRKHHSSPRSFLWRVLENDTVLSIRVADLCKLENVAEAGLVVNLKFPTAIRGSCLDFSDPPEHDVLCVFVVDQANVLYSITLRPEAFRKKAATEGGLGDACKTYSPPGFGFKHPHRLVAVNADQLIVTMHDGGILKFDKNRSHDASNPNPWKETIYNVAGWGQSLRGLMPFHRSSTLKFEKVNMELTAATSATVVTMGRPDTAFLFTVCLDHRLRVWDVNTGQILYTGDILDSSRDPQELGKWTIDPTQGNLIRIVGETAGQCFAVTFSPVGAGEFKFWEVKVNDQGSLHVADCFPGSRFIPPSPSADVWTMADFVVAYEADGADLWVLWKNNITYRSQKVHIPSKGGRKNLDDGWEGVFIDSNGTNSTSETAGPCDPVDATEKWLDTILYPGRFSRSTIETALAMYERGLGTTKESASKLSSVKSLAESICSVIGATASLERNSEGHVDFDQFRGSSETQWLRLWRLLLEIDKLGGEALSMAFDPETKLVDVVCAGSIASIRECGDLERVFYNLDSPGPGDGNVAGLIIAGIDFLGNFTDGMCQVSRAALQAELFDDTGEADIDRMQAFSDRAAFWRQLTEEDCSPVVENLGANFQVVTQKLYQDFFQLMKSSNSPDPTLPLTEYGKKLVLRAVQGTVELHWRVLFAQLILLVHMEFEFETEEEALHSRFDVGAVYRHMIAALRRLEHVRWMTRTEMWLPAAKIARLSLGSSGPPPAISKDESCVVTPLEGILGHLLGLNNHQQCDRYLTDVAVDLCAPNSDTELLPFLQQCWLLKLDRPDLAVDLIPFNDHDPFSTYIQGRVFLALKNFDEASAYFRKAAIGLSIPSKTIGRHSVGLLDDTEWNLLQSGLPNYYLHIVNLYDKHRAHSFVIEFGRIGLQVASSPKHDKDPVKNELRSRLFTSALAISHFDVAHATLLSMEDPAMQNSYLRKLIERMCETGQNAEMASLPFSGLQMRVDDILLEKCRQTRDVLHGTPYHRILYGWRIAHNDYRGAAGILLDRLQKLQALGEGDKIGADDVMDTAITRQYLLVINALSCVPAKDAYVLEDLPEGQQGASVVDGEEDLEESFAEIERALEADLAQDRAASAVGEDTQLLDMMKKFAARPHARDPPRRLLTLSDIRKHYQQELDRIVAIQSNQFGLVGEDVMEIA